MRLTNLALQGSVERGCVDLLTTEYDEDTAPEGTVIGNLRDAEVSRDALLHDVTTSMRRENEMEIALIIVRTEVDECSGVGDM